MEEFIKETAKKDNIENEDLDYRVKDLSGDTRTNICIFGDLNIEELLIFDEEKSTQ